MEMLAPDCKYPFLVFDNVIKEDDLHKAFMEIDYLSNFTEEPSNTGTATDEFGNELKLNKGISLIGFYSSYNINRYSTICKSLSKMFTKDAVKTIRGYNPVFLHFIPERMDEKIEILLSIYSDGNYYLPHQDSSAYTAILWLNEEPKSYEGGRFLFHFEDGQTEEVETKSNRMVLFPSFYTHEVTEVKYLSKNALPRFSVSTLLHLNTY